MKIDFIASDIDRTFIDENRNVSKYTRSIIRKLPQHQIHFALVTGRPFQGAFRIAHQIGLEPHQFGVIVLNGLKAYDGYENLLFEEPGLNYQDCLILEEVALKFNLGIHYSFLDQSFIQMEEKNYQKYLSQRKKRNHHRPRVRIDNLNQIKEYFDQEEASLKVVFIQEKTYLANIIKEVQAEFPTGYDCYLVGPGWAEIMPKRINKGIALKRYAKLKNLELAKTVVFGDAENDLAMFQIAKQAIAVKNAYPRLKAISTSITKNHYDDGVAHAIAQLLKI